MKKSDITKEKTLTAAEQIFSEKGFAGARVDEIAEVSSVNKRALYFSASILCWHLGEFCVNRNSFQAKYEYQ